MKLRVHALLVLLTMNTALKSEAAEMVVLLHGLSRTEKSMVRMEEALGKEGFQVINIGYPSTKHPLEVLASDLRERIGRETAGAERVNFVTHSMGGIVVRYMQKHFPLENIGRVVMLSPPNQGSEVVDTLGKYRLFQIINGPAGRQMGKTGGSILPSLGPVEFELGVITGDRSMNWILSTMIPGKDDGKVSVESARVDGMRDFKVVHATHPLIMKNRAVIRDIVAFLRTGAFTANA